MEQAGEICLLRVHPVFPLFAFGSDHAPVKIGRFTPDFAYNREGEIVVEDVKGGRATATEAYRLRKRLFEACSGLKLTEVGR